MVVFLGQWVARIPMAALVAVMIMVGRGTFSWSAIANLRTHPKSSSVVMIATVVVVVVTHDLARGVFVGVLLSALFFARRALLGHYGDQLAGQGGLEVPTRGCGCRRAWLEQGQRDDGRPVCRA